MTIPLFCAILLTILGIKMQWDMARYYNPKDRFMNIVPSLLATIFLTLAGVGYAIHFIQIIH